MKSRRDRGNASSCSRSTFLMRSESRLSPRTSRLQRPRYSTRGQWSMRLAVAESGSAVSAEMSAQKGLRGSCSISLLDDHADHLSRHDRLAGSDGELRDLSGPVRRDLVL